MDKGTLEQVNGLWLKEGQVDILMDTKIKLRILEVHYDKKMVAYLGQDKNLELIAWDYTWLVKREFVNEYIRMCDTCSRNKILHCCYYDQLHPLPISSSPWKSVSMDFIVQLPMT